MDIMKALQYRYATKAFDSSRELSEDQLNDIETLLQMAPSSTNLQPWNFVIATSKEGKEKIAQSTQGFFQFNEQKIYDASAVVVFNTKIDIDEDFLNHVIDVEDKDGRYASEDIKNEVYKGRKMFSDLHKEQIKDLKEWNEKQLYLNLGNFLLGVAALGIDAVPMEGFDAKVLDDQLNLTESGFTSTLVVPVGFRAKSDYNADIPKSRLAKGDIITRI